MPFRPTIGSSAYARLFSLAAVIAVLSATPLLDSQAATYAWTGAAGDGL